MLDTKALAEATALIVRDHVNAVVSPLLERIAALEARELLLPEKGEQGEPGPAGKDADMEQIKTFIAAEVAQSVEAAVSALPPPEKGEKGEPGEQGPQGEKGDAGEPGRDGSDGVGMADAMIDRSNELVITMTDGRIKNLGCVVGRDGTDGKDGDTGAPGADGRDGRDLDDLEITQDGAIVEFAFQVGENRKLYEIELPAGPAGIDGKDAYPGEAKGLYDPNGEYLAMDVVSHNGSEWRAKIDNPGELPGPGWMLSACRGKRGERGEKGAPGSDGVSIVAQYLRGNELVMTLGDGAELKTDLSELITRD